MSNWRLNEARILVVDDNVQNTILLSQLLDTAGYRKVYVEMDSRRVLTRIKALRPDLIILDLHMPEISGIDILDQLRDNREVDAFTPVLVCTADWTEPTRKRALDLGAWDFITKPYNTTEMLLRIRNFLRMREMHLLLEEKKRGLETLVARRTKHVIRARTEALDCLARAGEFRDDITGEHAQRVANLSSQIASELGLSVATQELIKIAAPLHDLGKIGIPDAILLKPGKLTEPERETMKEHAVAGATIIGRAKSPQLRKAREIALYHHENWDGTGYPHGTRGEEIPISARIVAVADTFDALINERPYKRAWPRNEAVNEIRRLSGTRFDPRVVDAFARIISPMVAVVEVQDLVHAV